MSVKTTRVIYSLLIATIIVLPLVFFSSGFFTSTSEKVLPGVEVMGIQLGGLSRPEGLDRLAELEKDLRASRVVLRYQERSWPLLLNEVGLGLNKEAIMEEALNTGRRGSLIMRWQERKQLAGEGRSLQPALEFDREKLTQRVKELTREITVEPKEATFQINSNETVAVVPGKDGVGVDFDRLEKDIVSVLLDGKKPEVTLSLVNVAPGRSTEFMESMGVNGLLASYTTRFDPAKVSRSYNVSVAAQAFDELLIRPGHEVSFNRVVGPRSSEAGYKNAPVIINNEFVDGLGGGVCQVSTTLYNAVLLANLEVVERTNHSLPVSYVPVGRDATVVYDALDFKFRNNTESYLYIKSFVYGGQITFKIYGNTAYKRDVSINSWVTGEIEPKVIYENDPNLPKGEQVVKQEGAKGFRVSAERVVRLNGVVKKREALPASDYSPVNRVIAVGTLEQSLPQIVPSTPSPAAGQPATPPVVNQEAGGADRTAQPGNGVNTGNSGGTPAGTGSTGNSGANPAIPGTKPTGNAGGFNGINGIGGESATTGQGGQPVVPGPSTGKPGS
jgi:vancomycin resistance protein YoaR